MGTGAGGAEGCGRAMSSTCTVPTTRTNRTATRYQWSATTGEMFVNGAGQGAPGGERRLPHHLGRGRRRHLRFSNCAGGVTVDLRPGSYCDRPARRSSPISATASRRAATSSTRSCMRATCARSSRTRLAVPAPTLMIRERDRQSSRGAGCGGDYLFGFDGSRPAPRGSARATASPSTTIGASTRSPYWAGYLRPARSRTTTASTASTSRASRDANGGARLTLSWTC